VDGDEFPLGGESSSHRVVSGHSGPSLHRSRRLLVVLAALALVGAGVVLIRADERGSDGSDASGRAEGADDGDDAGSGEPASDAEMEVTDVEDVSVAFAEAVVRLGEAHTFAYRGTVRAEGPSVLRPVHDADGDDTVQVEGAVHLPLSITTEVAVTDEGAITETVTTGREAWSRGARELSALESATWTTASTHDSEDRRFQPAAPHARQGMALLANVLRVSGDRREGPRDDAGRQVFRATVPDQFLAGSNNAAAVSELLSGAELAIVLDERGDVVHVTLDSAPGRPVLALDLDIVRHGDPGLVTAGELEPIASTVPADVLAYVGIGSLNLPGLPSRWALTDAKTYGQDDYLILDRVPCGDRSLWLEYNDLTGVAEGRLTLGVFASPDGCEDARDPDDSETVSAGRFRGWVYDPWADQYGGWLTDGTTTVAFTSDLPLDAATAAVASLAPAG
jgi:hypothetical protein